MLKVMMILSLLFGSYKAFAQDVIRCNKVQDLCEIKNKRVTIGDKIGVFTPEGFIVAIGEVTKIRDTTRSFKINRSFATILKSHRAQIINDKEAKHPEKFFKLLKSYPESFVGGKLGSYSMGIGDGFVATNFEAQYALKWENLTYFIFKANYLMGSGEASAKLQRVSNTTLDISVFGLSGGLAQIFFPYETISFRAAVDLGLGMASIKLGGDYDVPTVLNDRIIEGTILMARSEFAAVYKWEKYYPMVTIDLLYLHNSFNTGISLGVMTEL